MEKSNFLRVDIRMYGMLVCIFISPHELEVGGTDNESCEYINRGEPG